MGISRSWGTWLAVGLLVSGGCSSTGGKRGDAGAEADAQGAQAAQEGAAGEAGVGQATPLGEDPDLSLTALDDPDSIVAVRVVYFDYDSSELTESSREVLIAHGKLLANNTQQKVRLEGHTDERGSREYNLGLGERRAWSVSQMLMAEGVGGDQLEVVSYGEETPADYGHDDRAYQQNRRVEIVYLGR
ncbi:MAG: peptidoglycan-associated lipoprotein Pal [Pseudomonadota bacterium]|nr:peptidoglycan-associated lipoprotein Pal [Pseudomonadota bacterium]